MNVTVKLYSVFAKKSLWHEVWSRTSTTVAKLLERYSRLATMPPATNTDSPVT